MPEFIKYEGYTYNSEDLTVLIDGKWEKLPKDGVPPITRALEDGEAVSPDQMKDYPSADAETGDGEGAASE